MVSGGLRWPAQFEASPHPARSGALAAFRGRSTIVAPELAVTRLDPGRVDFDIAGGGRRDPGRQLRAQLRQILGLLRKSLGDLDVAIVILGDPVIETDRSHDRPAGARRCTVAELGYDRHARIERFPGADAAVLRERVERYVDVRKRQQMLVARRRAQAGDILLGNACATNRATRLSRSMGSSSRVCLMMIF